MRRTVAVVPHTHWDREWYDTFQAYRLRLVELLDDFLPRLEADPSYARFMLDGQCALLDDYLEVRPEAEGRLRRLAAAGRLAVGPWYVLMDEFLVSGETIVRNLKMGLERSAAFGAAMAVGYLPDMFGHVGQMPQLLRQAGFSHAVVWRGVPAAVDHTAFWWSAPDGSTVRAERLWVGYGNGAAIPDDAKALVRRIRSHDDEVGPALPAGWPMLWLNGGDHEVPQPWLGRVVAEANEIQDDYHLVVTSLEEHLPTAPVEGLPSWTGELRSGARANLLMGVASNHVDVKQAAARAERALERRAEPMSALLLSPDAYPTRLLEQAWREVVRNSAHDSICACSADEVVAAVLHRYTEATQLAEGLARRALDALASSMADPGPVAFNSSARARGGLVELVLDDDDPHDGVQVVEAHPRSTERTTIPGRRQTGLVGDVLNQAARVAVGVVSASLGDGGGESPDPDASIEVGPGTPAPGTDAVLAELYARAGALGDRPISVEVVHRPWQRVLAYVPEVPGFGWVRWDGGGPQAGQGPPPVVGHGLSLDNGVIRVEVDPYEGTFSIDGRGRFDRLVDSLDAGDTYTYSPPGDDVVVEQPSSVSVEVEEPGPLRGRLVVRRSYSWQGHDVPVATRVELRAGEDLVRVETSLVNPVGDHRLRSHFDLPERATVSRAECAFDVVERGLEAEGGDHELGLPTFPSRRFVSAGGLTVVHEGLPEYEVVDDGRVLALTLLRSTGRLSGGAEVAYRVVAAGPPTEVPGAQLLGPRTMRYAVHVGAGDPFALADAAFLPLELAMAPGGGPRPATGAALAVEGAEVSAVVRTAGSIEVRLFNPTSDQTTVTLAGRSGWLVDLRGRPLEPFEGALPLPAHGLVTARLGEG